VIEMADFATMLKYLREREQLSQRSLADKLNMSPSAIGMYESGKRMPRPEDEEAIADFFNVDLNTLRGKRTNENPGNISNEDRELLERYHNASPEDRAIVDLALKRSQQKL
jgi:transcriptional regulator with XRE-family HTH domain